MNENEKDKHLRKLFKIKEELGVPPHLLKTYDIFEHMLGLKDNQAVPEGLMLLYKSAKNKSDSLFSGAELPMQTLIILAVLHQTKSSEVTVAVAKRHGRPPKPRSTTTEVLTA